MAYFTSLNTVIHTFLFQVAKVMCSSCMRVILPVSRIVFVNKFKKSLQFINKVLKNVGCFLMIRAFLFKTLFNW